MCLEVQSPNYVLLQKMFLKNMMCKKKDKIMEHLGLLIVKTHWFI